MRIVIDMQGAQTESRFRGIGRYTLSFVKAVVLQRGEHEVFLALSGLFPDTIELIRAEFEGLLSQENIRVWHAPGPVKASEFGNDSRRQVAELIREAFLTSLHPDVVHITSFFEGYGDDAVTSIGRFDQLTPVTVVLFDLIPLINPDHYLKPNPLFKEYYNRKIHFLHKSRKMLAISDFTRQEGIVNLKVSGDKVINISTAIEPCFGQTDVDEAGGILLCKRFGLVRPFVLYAGGADERKNLRRLIQAYAKLPATLRQRHQLVFAGKIPQGNADNLKQDAHKSGLKEDELVLTGYVSDEDLAKLYKISQLFVFPSWHEGFGLPALEAMACGAVVIGANTSSLPEVIGLEDALFDPMDVNAITNKLTQALVDESFRSRLRDHGEKQSKKFKWEETAKVSWEVWEGLSSTNSINKESIATSLQIELINALAPYLSSSRDKQLLSVSQCIALNASTGIERQLLIDVSELCQRDSATGVQRVVRSYLFQLLNSPPKGFRVLPVYASQTEGYRYATTFTASVLKQNPPKLKDQLIRWQRGDLFFGLDMQHHVQLAHSETYSQMRQSGVVVKFMVYDLLPIQLADHFKDSRTKALHEQLLKMIAIQDEAICISKATAEAYENWLDANGVTKSDFFCTDWVHMGADLEGSKPSVGMTVNAPAVLETMRERLSFVCVSTIEPRKGQEQILNAIEQLWAEGADINLVLVGKEGWKVSALLNRIKNHTEINKRLFWLQGISDEYLQKVYEAGDCLIAASINEGFGLSLIEAARYGVPIVARDIPVFREVAGEHAYYFKGEDAVDLAKGLKIWIKQYKKDEHIKSSGLQYSTWKQSSEKLKVALFERSYTSHQVLIDISELIQRDAKTGIQRVVRNILNEWLFNPPQGYRVEAIYATDDLGYRYANKEKIKNNIFEVHVDDVCIDYSAGDIYFALDYQPYIQIKNRNFYKDLRNNGVQTVFVVYDLLCIKNPEYFVSGSDALFSQWLIVVAESDRVICISQSVAQEFDEWLNVKRPKQRRLPKIEWFHLGANLMNIRYGSSLSPIELEVLELIKKDLSFLMVGTVEPRKGHEQVLDAFEQLWTIGLEVNLVIVGKEGWMVKGLAEKVRMHSRLGKRLFWLENVNDIYLEKVYEASHCLIAASYGEGFGLPLIEAGQRNLPIIARNLPVFREVAGDYAYYFEAENPYCLAQHIRVWLNLYQENKQPKSEEMKWFTWKESAKNLMKTLLTD